MEPDINERIEREAEYFDHKQFQREGYEAALAYLNNGIGRQRRNDVVRASLQEATGKRALEIGSQSWEWCLFRYRYRPTPLTGLHISPADTPPPPPPPPHPQSPPPFFNIDPPD